MALGTRYVGRRAGKKRSAYGDEYIILLYQVNCIVVLFELGLRYFLAWQYPIGGWMTIFLCLPLK